MLCTGPGDLWDEKFEFGFVVTLSPLCCCCCTTLAAAAAATDPKELSALLEDLIPPTPGPPDIALDRFGLPTTCSCLLPPVERVKQ
jgi:hypothetical protein